MAAMDTTRFLELCRLCAAKTCIGMGIHIFENEGAIRQINKKIETCLPLHVHEVDGLPKMICENCLYKLELFFEFRDRCIRTETILIDLYKEINSSRIQSKQNIVHINDPLDIVSMDHHDLIMVPQQQLLNEHGIQNVSDLDLNQLSNRENMIVGHEIILAHQNVDISNHSLDTIDLNHQELSNHSLQTQSRILVDENGSVHSLQDTGFAESNLDLIQEHQIINEAYVVHDIQRNQHKLHQANLHDDLSQHKIHQSLSEHNGRDSLSGQITIDANAVSEIHYPESSIHLHENISTEVHQTSNGTESYIPASSNSSETKECDFTEVKTTVSKFKTELSEDSNSDNHLLIDDISDVKCETYAPQSNDKKPCPIDNIRDKEFYYCNICGKSFEEKINFNKHYDKHFNKCHDCMAVFTNKEALSSHRKEVHGTNPEETKIKPSKLKTESSLTENSIINNESRLEYDDNSDDSDALHNDTEEAVEEEETTEAKPTNSSKRKKWSPKVCKECGKSYKTNYKLMEHMRKHTGEKPYKCGSCDKAFRSKIGLAQHEAKHTGQYDYSCQICGKGFQCKSYLMVHQRVHSDVKPYPCTTCGQNFKTKQSLLDHTNRHLGVKPYLCDICGRGFITKGLCRAHQRIHTGLDNRKYSCKVCNKMFVSKSYLQTHLRIHTGEKPFICEVCGKGFLTRVDLRIHTTMHTGEKSYVCEICGKAFARRDALRCHRRSHTGERPYSCDQCGQTFTQFSPMAIHKRLHTGERPYVCETCGKKFVSKSTMMAHSKKHCR